MDRPSGTVTFLFTDIEGSTRRWESDPEAMRAALAVHDEVLRAAVEGHGGWLFKHTGDGVCAAFGSARFAIDAAVDAQRRLELPVRMGLATGEAELRGEDYFGPTLNRAARVMGAGHGGQILVAASTAALLDGAGPPGLIDLGEHRLRDLSGAHRLFQVRADGLDVAFPVLRTLDEVPGNLPTQSSSFIGRDLEVKELAELVRAHRLVTLTGVGGVGKTRLAVQVAAELISEFPDGAWLVELAPVGDPEAASDAVASVLGITPQAGMSVAASVAQALSGRRLLVVLDNCEHVLNAAADLVDTILGRAPTVRLLTTSREGLGVGAEQLWPVPSLDVRAGPASAAVELFVERARAVIPGFGLGDDSDSAAVMEICARLDGIPLAIELAAARMVALSPQDVRDRLGDRFRLLAGGRRGFERHQTLRHAVGWSYDLLNDDERTLLTRCSVFAGGFDLVAASAICGGEEWDEYAVLDGLESLVRKSLVTAGQAGGHVRYGMLETIRQFAEDQLATTTTAPEVRDRHARYFAEQTLACWAVWEGPGYRQAATWVEAEFANLRAGFRWATEQGNLVDAAAIAAHCAMMGFYLNLFEPIGWAEEIIPAATTADLAHLPRLYTAAGSCGWVGRPEAGADYGKIALALADDARYDPFDPARTRYWAGVAEVLVTGDLHRWIGVCAELSVQSGLGPVCGLAMLCFLLPAAGRIEEARAIAAETLSVARAHGSPVWITFALIGNGRAFAETEPQRALDALHEALSVCDEQKAPFWEVAIAQVAAGLEAAHGDLERGLELFDTALTAAQFAGNRVEHAGTFAELAVFFEQAGQPEIAATVYGASTRYADVAWVLGLATAVEHLRSVLGPTSFDELVAAGAAMDPGDAVAFARQRIQDTRTMLGSSR